MDFMYFLCGDAPLGSAGPELLPDASEEETPTSVSHATPGSEAAREDTPTTLALAAVVARPALLDGAAIPEASVSAADVNGVGVLTGATVRRARLLACRLLAEEVSVAADDGAPLLPRFSPATARRRVISPTAAELPPPLPPTEGFLLETLRGLIMSALA